MRKEKERSLPSTALSLFTVHFVVEALQREGTASLFPAGIKEWAYVLLGLGAFLVSGKR